jgi:ABC-2 type transport system ATP-binding protein
MIKIEGLKKKFGEFTAVDGLSFDISKNEIFGLLGPNGAGKTTTINMICGLLSPSEGLIRFDVTEGHDHKSLIGYCPQENILYPKLTCYEQLLFIGQMYGITSKGIKQKGYNLLEMLGLKDKANEMASTLSGGMKRRLNICLALIHDPEILILDEPETGLDPQSRILVREFIKLLGKEKTVLLTTHNMDEADRLADRIAIIDYGKLLLLDSPQNLKKTIDEGDILEIIIEKSDEQTVNKFIERMPMFSDVITKGSNSVLIKHPNIIEHIPEIKDNAEISGLLISEIKLRENTLEDVFIHLTGRNLRQ